MYKIIHLILVFGLLVLFFSDCEFELEKENISNVQKPDSLHPIVLNLIPDGDTINITRDTIFRFSINSLGLKVLQCKFSLGDNEWVFHSTEGFFPISPEKIQPGIYVLHCLIITNSGTGSIADLLGVEGYSFEKSWYLVINRLPQPIIAESGVSDDNFLLIRWSRCDEEGFAYYNIKSSTGIDKKIFHVDSNFIIDYSYVGGKISYRIDLKFKNNYVDTLIKGKWLNVDTYIPSIDFVESLDTLSIYWLPSRFTCRYRLVRTDLNPPITLYETVTDDHYSMSQLGFGMNAEYTLYTEPYVLTDENINYIRQSVAKYSFGKPFTNSGSVFAYNKSQDILYVFNNKIRAYDIYSLTEAYSFPASGNPKAITSQSNSDRVAAYSNGNIYVFSDASLMNPEIIAYPAGTIDHFFITDNNLIAVAFPNRYELIDIITKTTLRTIFIDDYPENNPTECISTSSDGKYVCIVNRNGLKLYNTEAEEPALEYSDNRSYSSAVFSNYYSNLLYITFADNNTLEGRKVPDFRLEKEIPLSSNGQILRGDDPVSGYILTTDYNFLYITSPVLPDFGLKIKCRDDEKLPGLFKRKLFSEAGYALDIGNYLP